MYDFGETRNYGGNDVRPAISWPVGEMRGAAAWAGRADRTSVGNVAVPPTRMASGVGSRNSRISRQIGQDSNRMAGHGPNGPGSGSRPTRGSGGGRYFEMGGQSYLSRDSPINQPKKKKCVLVGRYIPTEKKTYRLLSRLEQSHSSILSLTAE